MTQSQTLFLEGLHVEQEGPLAPPEARVGGDQASG